MDSELTQTTLYISPKLLREFKAMCASLGSTMSDKIVVLIQDFLQEQKTKIDEVKK